jgi:hypothetical protein
LVIGKEYIIKGIGEQSNLYHDRRTFEGRRCRLLGFFKTNKPGEDGVYPGVYIEMDIDDCELPASTTIRVNTLRATEKLRKYRFDVDVIGTPGRLMVQCCSMCLEDCEEDLEYDKYDQE